MEESTQNQAQYKRQQSSSIFRGDVILWATGMVFIFALLAAMFGFGHVRQWDAQSGYTHNQSATSQTRFLPEPVEPEPGVAGRSDPSASGRWYYWQLPPEKVTAWSRIFVWLCYIGHQLTIWGTIYYAQRKKTSADFSGPKYSKQISVFNIVPFLLNIIFHVLHLAQTHITYDALAQDVSEASSQGSVIMMLVLVLLMEYRDRGLFFGWPTAQHKDKISRKLRFSQAPINLVRKYHGYAFSWAVIYTFWYHPMENTWGHAFGFIHTWMVMLQGSLMYTSLHRNRIWRLVLESWVTLHGLIVAKQTGGPDLNGTALWPMFCFGFLWLFTMTQLFGLTFWKKAPWWTKAIPFLCYLAVCVWCYSWIPDKNGNYFVRLQEIIRIPAIEYICVIFAWFVIDMFLRIKTKLTSTEERSASPSPFWETFCIGCFMLIYSLMVLVSFLLQEFDLTLDLIALMVILVFIFILGTGLSFMIIEPVMKKRSGKTQATEYSKSVGMANTTGDVSAEYPSDDQSDMTKKYAPTNDGNNAAFQSDH
ncbi:uncharacterized protein [Amphiura filiformis]|uniref:uncharacterized protein n=1 Tax=Amphiura filiformis TaxID=82378 RepID=UPI003B20DC54